MDSASGTSVLYLNGAAVATNITYTGSLIYDSHPVLVGCEIEGETQMAWFSGDADEVSIYNRVLSSSECVFGKWQKSTLTLLYKGFHSYRWEGCKRIQLIIQLT